MFLQTSVLCHPILTEILCPSALARTTQDAVVKLVASLTSMGREQTQDVADSSIVFLRACKHSALEHPLAQARVDPAFGYAITHRNVIWAHGGLYSEYLLQKLTVTEVSERQALWNAAVDEYIAKGSDHRPVEEVRVLGCDYS